MSATEGRIDPASTDHRIAAKTPAERRGYPLPPWAAEPYLATTEHNGADVLEYLLDLASSYPEADGVRQAEAYLDAWLDRHRRAQAVASRCLIEDHASAAELLERIEGLTTELRDARAAVRDAYDAGHAAGVEFAAARQYVDGHLPDDVVELLALLERDEDELGTELVEGAGYDEPAAVKCPAVCPCGTSS